MKIQERGWGRNRKKNRRRRRMVIERLSELAPNPEIHSGWKGDRFKIQFPPSSCPWLPATHPWELKAIVQIKIITLPPNPSGGWGERFHAAVWVFGTKSETKLYILFAKEVVREGWGENQPFYRIKCCLLHLSYQSHHTPHIPRIEKDKQHWGTGVGGETLFFYSEVILSLSPMVSIATAGCKQPVSLSPSLSLAWI